jgi:hypothetical protein
MGKRADTVSPTGLRHAHGDFRDCGVRKVCAVVHGVLTDTGTVMWTYPW